MLAFVGNPRAHGLLTGLCLPAKMLVSFCFTQCHVDRGEQLRLSIRISTSFSGPLTWGFYGARETTLFNRTCCRENPTAESNFSPPRHWGHLLGCSQHCLRSQVPFTTNPVDLGFPSERFAQGIPIAWLQQRLSPPTSSVPFSHRYHTCILVCGLSLSASAATEQDPMRPSCNRPWPYPRPVSHL